MSISRDWAPLASQNERLAQPEDALHDGALGAIRTADPRESDRDHRESQTGSLRRPAWLRRKAA
jgi:hypothetical protein